MASTKADNNRVGWGYVDDDGTTWRKSAKAVYVQDATDGAKYGGALAGATVDNWPKSYRARAVKCTSAGHPDRWIVAYTVASDLWATPGTTLTRDLNGTDTVYTSTKQRRGERKGRQTSQTT